jgi:hypothetical protein
MAELDRPLLFPSIGFRITSESNVETVPAGQPSEGATLTDESSSFNLYNDSGARVYLPGIGGGVLGLGLVGGLYNETSTIVDDEFSTTGETITTEDGYASRQIAPNGLFAASLGSVDVGAGARVHYYTNPAQSEFDQVSGDPAANEIYTTEGSKEDRKYLNIAGAVGVVQRQAGTEFGLGVTLGRTTDDTSNRWVPVDKDGNGFNESIVEDETRVTSSESWGLGLDHYERVQKETRMHIGLHPHAIIELSSGLSVVASGYFYPISKTDVESFTHTDADDKSKYTSTSDSSLVNFGILGGVEQELFRRFVVRTGLGFETLATTFSQEDLDPNGDSTYDPDNTNHYREVSYGVDGRPNDGQVIADANDPAYRRTIFSLPTGIMWTPVDDLRFYAEIEAQFVSETNTYNVFNQDDGVVWTEVEKRSDYELDLNPVIGFVFQATDSLAFGMQTWMIDTYLSGDKSTDALPEGPDGATTSPAGNLDDTANNEWSVRLEMILGL